MPLPQIIVFTDLDGTLLDHHSYSYAAALPALARLKDLGIPVVINTSKTAAEIEQLRSEIGNTDPYVVENGAAVIIPENQASLQCTSRRRQQLEGKVAYVFGEERGYILQRLEKAKAQLSLRLTGYNDWTAGDVARHTGLPLERAALSLQRGFSEPLLWQHAPEDHERLSEMLDSDGLQLLVGGRFTHVIGKGGDKGICMQALCEAYQSLHGKETLAIALGDSPNDIAMLEAADIAVVIRSPVKKPPGFTQPAQTPLLKKLGVKPLYITENCGPEGWAEVMQTILNQVCAE